LGNRWERRRGRSRSGRGRECFDFRLPAGQWSAEPSITLMSGHSTQSPHPGRCVGACADAWNFKAPRRSRRILRSRRRYTIGRCGPRGGPTRGSGVNGIFRVRGPCAGETSITLMPDRRNCAAAIGKAARQGRLGFPMPAGDVQWSLRPRRCWAIGPCELGERASQRRAEQSRAEHGGGEQSRAEHGGAEQGVLGLRMRSAWICSARGRRVVEPSITPMLGHSAIGPPQLGQWN
jgi:hypothetical protein